MQQPAPDKGTAVASVPENKAAEVTLRRTLIGQVFVRLPNVRRTIPLDFQTARGFSIEALVANIREVYAVNRHSLIGTDIILCLRGRRIHSGEELKKELRVGDTL